MPVPVLTGAEVSDCERRPVGEDALVLSSVSKRFGGVQALDGVSLTIPRMSVHGLVGANGSGKSTLVKILTGYHVADDGHIEVWGRPASPRLGQPVAAGISTIHQDLGLIPTMSVLENVIQASDFGVKKASPIRWRAERRRVRALLAHLDIDLNPDTLVGDLGRGERTLVAVARALSELQSDDQAHGSGTRHLLIMDEPTAALNATEALRLHKLLRRVADAGGAALLISHHLQEVREVCDEITILRDGRRVATVRSSETSQDDLLCAMVGEEVARTIAFTSAMERPPREAEGIQAPAVLDVEGLTGDGVHNVSLRVGPGEILGITGLLGQGPAALAGLIAGATTPDGGIVRVNGTPLRLGSLPAALNAGVVLVPAERRRDGLWMAATVAENLGLSNARRGFFYSRRRERIDGLALARRYGVTPAQPTALLSTLSGGNQQKVLVAKALRLKPKVLLMHEPTQGVDIAAKDAIHSIVRAFVRETGAAACVFSSDQDEVAALCDRVAVMARGAVVGNLSGEDITLRAMASLSNAGGPQ